MRTKTKSPLLNSWVANIPGGNGIFRVVDLLIDAMKVLTIFVGIMAGAAGVLLGSLLSMRWTTAVVLVVGALAVAGLIVYFLRARRRIDSIIQGIHGERSAAAILAELGADGYAILHDLEAPAQTDIKPFGNIDHVAIGPAGVLCIEVKAISKPRTGNPKVTYDGHTLLVNGRPPLRDPIHQVDYRRRIVEDRLRGANVRAPVIPIVLYPGWWVESANNPKRLFSFVRARPAVLSPADVRRCYQALLPMAASRTHDDDEPKGSP
jgi:hypothetical protein